MLALLAEEESVIAGPTDGCVVDEGDIEEDEGTNVEDGMVLKIPVLHKADAGADVDAVRENVPGTWDGPMLLPPCCVAAWLCVGREQAGAFLFWCAAIC